MEGIYPVCLLDNMTPSFGGVLFISSLYYQRYKHITPSVCLFFLLALRYSTLQLACFLTAMNSIYYFRFAAAASSAASRRGPLSFSLFCYFTLKFQAASSVYDHG